MDRNLFTAWTRAFSRRPSRRAVLGGLAGVGLSLGGPWRSEVEAAKKRKKRKKRKGKKSTPFQLPPLVFNQHGCIDVGQPCRGDSSNCCSCMCQGPAPAAGQPDTSTCVAHNTSICKPSTDLCTSGVQAVCNANKPNRACVLTTGNAGFCADFTPHIEAGGGADASFYCRDCSHDRDCQAEFGSGAACVVYGGVCSQYCAATGGRACMGAGDA
jgi:hypothetical protein